MRTLWKDVRYECQRAMQLLQSSDDFYKGAMVFGVLMAECRLLLTGLDYPQLYANDVHRYPRH